jgi:predicted nucleic acid-binding protein
VIICDTGPLVAAADRDEEHNRECTDLFTGLHLARRQILVPAPVIAEVGHLLQRNAGPGIEAQFLRSIPSGGITIVDLEFADYERMADLVDTYADFPLGTTDASIIAVAERLGVTEVATLDRRHFHAVRPRHVDALSLLPRPSRHRRHATSGRE